MLEGVEGVDEELQLSDALRHVDTHVPSEKRGCEEWRRGRAEEGAGRSEGKVHVIIARSTNIRLESGLGVGLSIELMSWPREGANI